MFEQPATKKQKVDDFGAHNYVDICDDDIMSMWKSTNSEQVAALKALFYITFNEYLSTTSLGLIIRFCPT